MRLKIMSNPVGRPTSYNAEITEKIIDLVIDGQPIRFICSQVDMPSVATVMRWLHDYPEFAKQYALAKEMYAHCIFDEIQQHSLFYRSASSENTVFSGNHTAMIPF